MIYICGSSLEALGVSGVAQLVDAARSSQLLELNAEGTKIRLASATTSYNKLSCAGVCSEASVFGC